MHEAVVNDIPMPGGRRLRLRTWPGQGRPLVLLHGLLDSSAGWSELARSSHRPCLAFDLPGFGGSDMVAYPRIDAYACDIVAGLHRLGVEDCSLVGHSLGGAVAALVAERTAAVHSLTLLAPAGFGILPLAEALSLPGLRDLAGVALPFALASPLLVAAGYSAFVTHRRLPSRELLRRLSTGAFSVGSGTRAAILALAASGRSADALHRRQLEFGGPVAGLWGEHDQLVPRAHIRALRRSAPQAHVEVWPAMGHHPQRERPAQLARFIEGRATRARRVRRMRHRVSRISGGPAAA